MGEPKGLKFKVEFHACSTPDECLRLCSEGKPIKASPEVLRSMAHAMPRDCVVLVGG